MSEEGPAGDSHLRREGGHALLYSLILVMVLFWSGNFIIGKVALREFPPLLAGGLRTSLAGVFMLPFFLWERARRGPETWTSRDWLILASLGVCGVALNQVFFLVGLSRTSVAHSAFVISLMPVLVLLIAAAVGQEQLTARKLAGMAIAMAGVVIMNALPAPSNGSPQATLLGDIFIFLAGLTFAAFTVFGKQMSSHHSAITINTFGYVGGGLALAPVTLWQGSDFRFGDVSWAGWASLLYMALFPSVLAYLIYYFALARIPASRVAAFAYLQPVLALLLAALTLGERVTLPVVAGGAVIFSGVYLTERGA